MRDTQPNEKKGSLASSSVDTNKSYYTLCRSGWYVCEGRPANTFVNYLKVFFTLMNSFYVFFPELKRRRQMFFRISKQLVSLSDKIEILCDIYYSI